VKFLGLGPIARGGVFPGDGLAERLQRGRSFPGFIEAEILKKLPWGSFIVGGDHLWFPAFAPGAKKRGTGTKALGGSPSSGGDECQCVG
jgi:hypothetical protein